MQRVLIVSGLLILLAGLFWPWLSQFPIGRLPGDIVINKPGFRLFIPVTTMIIVSLLASVVLWLFRQ